MSDDRMTILGYKVPRRTIDWYHATRVSAGVTMCGALATLVYADTSSATTAPISFVDIAVLVGIVTQTVTIGFFAGAVSNRLKNLEKARDEHRDWVQRELETAASNESLRSALHRIETIERRCEAEAFKSGSHSDHR